MSRYNDRDSRAPPPRERSPASRSYRPAESYNPNFSSRAGDSFRGSYHDARAPPRGPRGVNDTPGRSAPTAPRGRGAFAGRSDSRDARDTAFSSDRFYEGGDRWDPGRRRSPVRDRRDSRGDFPPRQLDTDRARQEARDGPPSAGSNPSDGGFRGSASTFRGGYSRGRGNDFRDRSRIDDRARPRSRSRGRQERDRSVDSRDLDRRERQRDNNERSYVRDRDDRRDERETYPRRAEPPQRIETKQTTESRGAPTQLTPQTERPPVTHVTPPDRAAGEFRRDYDPSRRGSAVSDHIRDARRDSDRTDPNAGRPESQRAPRPASPPPAVPSFGFRAPAPFTGVTSLSWKNPDLQKPPPASGPAQPTKPAPTAPKGLSAGPPTAPKADRTLEKTPSKESLSGIVEDGGKERRMSAGASPSPRIASGSIQEPGQQAKFSPAVAATFLNPPSAPRAMTSPQPPFGRVAGATGFGQVTSPGLATNIPTGPKATTTVNASPRMLSSSIPTGPKAERAAPPSGPRNATVTSKLFRSNSQTFPRTSVVPSKRDVDGFERERSLSNEAKSGDVSMVNPGAAQNLSNGLTNVKSGDLAVKQEIVSAGLPQDDVDMADVPAAEQNVSPAVEDGARHFYHSSDDDDDNLDMAEMAEELEANYLREKSRLEAKRIDLSANGLRPTLLFPELARFVAMRAMINDLSYRPRIGAEKKDAAARAKETPLRDSVPVEIPTPREDNDQDQIMSDAYESRESSLDRMSTPDPESLPYLEKGPPTPLSDPDPFSIVKREISENDIKHLLKEDIDSEIMEQAKLEHEYRMLYLEWKKFTMSLDRDKEESERVAKQSSPESVTAPLSADATLAPLPTPTEGGRRTHRFASEYEIQRVMEISLREEEEKKQKELAMKEAAVSANADREADIPALLPPTEAKRRIFEDVSQARRPEDALRIFEFVPPVDDFTEEEDRLMRDVYKEYTKVWGKIAKIVRRTYKECINHYYASKWDRPYKSRIGGKRGRASRRGKPGRQRSALVPAEDAAEGDGSGTPMVTESGRPKRAAAPVWPKESDQDQTMSGTSTGKRGTKGDGKDSETGTEKPGRRKAKEKGPKKTGRNQPLAARPTISPQKVDRDAKEKPMQPMEVDDPWLVKPPNMIRQTEPMPSLMPQPHLYTETNLTVFREASEMGATGGPTDRPRSHSNTTQRQGASSYWSVTEEQDFKLCLEYYGTDFQSISNHMGTKTHTMIKNHYQKFVNDGKHGDLIQRANEATQRRSRGEDMGPPPIPSQAPKRHGRYDTSAVPMPRSLAPSNEVAEAEPSPPLSVAVPYGMSPQFGARSGLPPQVARTSAAPAASTPGHHSRPSGPIMGFFRDDIRPLIAPPEERQVQRGPERIKTEFQPNPNHDRDLLLRQEREREHHEELVRRAEMERAAQIAAERREREQFYQRPAALGHTPQPSIHGMTPATEHGRQDSRSHQNIFGQPMAGPAIHTNRNVIVDLTGPQAAALPGALERRPQSPARHSSQTSRIQQPQMPPAAPSPVPTPASKEAPRRSNLMSLLNSEPEPEQPKRREPEPPQYRITTAVQSETPTSAVSARDSLHERSYSRPTYPPAGQHPASSMSTPTNETGGRDSLPPMSHRDSWPGRQPPTFPQTNSPGLHPQHAPPPGPERPSLFGASNYRASAFGSLNGPSRANPSPPPAAPGFGQHSRKSSYNHPQHPTPPSSMPGPSSVPPSSLHGHPYGQKEPLGAGQSPHLGPQQHPPPSSRPEFAYSHQRTQDPRESLFDRFREREPEYAVAAAREREAREREREHQEQMAYQQRYGHHTPPVAQPRFPPPQAAPERNTATPLGHMAYPPPSQDPHSQAAMQRQHDIHQELQRRDFERERSRQHRIHVAAAEAEEVQRRRQIEAELRNQFRRPDERYPGMPPR